MQRGVAYSLDRPSTAGTEGVLVLTNDRWNDAMNSVGVVPLKQPFAEPTRLTPMVGALQAEAGKLFNLPQGQVAEPLMAPDGDELQAVEIGVCDVLDLARLTGSNPRSPQPPPGQINYPRWSEIYWVGGSNTGGETKRYIVVSNDFWNQQMQSSIVVRTTTSPRRRGSDEFPEIQQGGALAVCGEATLVPAGAVNARQRPNPSRLNLRDMTAIAFGVAHVLELHDTLGIDP
jgi:mRNA-degrading endonuclease toxin of MazEF toxin-antitoxin module